MGINDRYYDDKAEKEYRAMRAEMEAQRKLMPRIPTDPLEEQYCGKCKKYLPLSAYYESMRISCCIKCHNATRRFKRNNPKKPVRHKHMGGFTHVITSRYEDVPLKYSILAGEIPKGYNVIFQCQIGEVLPKFYWKLESYHEKYAADDSEPSKRVTRKRSVITKREL